MSSVETLPGQVLVANPVTPKRCSCPMSTVHGVQSLFLKKAEFPKEDYFQLKAFLSPQTNLSLLSTKLHSAHGGPHGK